MGRAGQSSEKAALTYQHSDPGQAGEPPSGTDLARGE